MAESQAQQASTRSPARKKAAGTGRRATGRPKARQTEAERQAAEAAAQEKRARKAAASAAKKAAKEAEKEAARAAKQAEKEAERAAKKARREEAKAAKKAAKQAEKQAKAEERARLRAEKEAEKEAEKVARAEERGRAAKCGADLAARVGCTAVHLVNLVNPTGNLVNLAATPTAAAVTNTTIALDEFIACGARIVALLFVNKLFIATKNGRAALDWVGGRLSGEAHDYEARFAMLCGPFCQVCLEFFQQLAAAACSIAGLADKACAVRRLWRAGGGDGAGPGTVAWEKCVGAAPKCAALVLHALEEGLWSEFLAQIGGNSQPSWDAPPPEAAAALPAAAREKLAYTIGWAFFATTREVRRDEHRSSASEIQRRLGHIAQFLRAAPGGGAAASGGYIAAVEREEGKLLRPTQLGFDFGLQLEVTIDHWLTVPRLLAIGGSLLAEVEQRLLDDNTLVALFRSLLRQSSPSPTHLLT